MKEGAKTLAIALVFLVLFAWALYVIMMAAAAQAHSLAMSEVRAGIAREIERKFSIRVIHQLSNCVRVDAHRGQCVIRLYTLPYRDKYCGVGWTQLRGKRQYSRANLTPCPGPARGLPGEHPDGHPIPASYTVQTSTMLALPEPVPQQTHGLTYEGLVGHSDCEGYGFCSPHRKTISLPNDCEGKRAPKVCRYTDRILRFPKPKPCPSWCQNTRRWV